MSHHSKVSCQNLENKKWIMDKVPKKHVRDGEQNLNDPPPVNKRG